VNTSFNLELSPGRTLTGKWNGRSYRVERALGEGANGKVYLVSREEGLYAMKIGADPVDLQSEANVLKVLSQGEGSFRRFLLDVDDLEHGGEAYPFYVMKYVKGRQVKDYLEARGSGWFPLVGLRLLQKLSELHEKGWIFGDLKKENILVSGYGDVELVDFGGVTPKGRAVKQFTEIYDRGYWNAGSRSADEAYDLFSFAILCINLCGRPKTSFDKQILPQNRSSELLLEEARKDPMLAEYMPFLEKAMTGGYTCSKEAQEEWKRMVYNRKRQAGGNGVSLGAASWIKAGFALSLLMFVGVLFYYS